MQNYVLIKIGYAKDYHEFSNQKEGFDWVKKTQKPCLVTVLTYERDQLETLYRYHFDGSRFKKENITH